MHVHKALFKTNYLFVNSVCPGKRHLHNNITNNDKTKVFRTIISGGIKLFLIFRASRGDEVSRIKARLSIRFQRPLAV